MSMHDELGDWEGPLPAELLDVPEGYDEGEIDATFATAEGENIPVVEAIESDDRWRVRTDDDAEWALRRIAAANADLEALHEKAKRWTEQITGWFEQAAREPARTAEFFTAQVERYAMAERREHDRKSVRLPSGKFSTRQSAEALEILDDDKVLAWAHIHAPDVVRLRADVLVSSLRGCLSPAESEGKWVVVETGEVVDLPPGVLVRPARVIPKVEVEG